MQFSNQFSNSEIEDDKLTKASSHNYRSNTDTGSRADFILDASNNDQKSNMPFFDEDQRKSQQVYKTNLLNENQFKEQSFYTNPNVKNHLSMMNISHLSQTFDAGCAGTDGTSPGLFVEGAHAQKLFTLVTTEDWQGLIQYLKVQPFPLDLKHMKDSRNFSILTYTAYRNQSNSFKILYEYIKRYGIDFKNEDTPTHEKIRDFVNETTDDQFTSLHFA